MSSGSSSEPPLTLTVLPSLAAGAETRGIEDRDVGRDEDIVRERAADETWTVREAQLDPDVSRIDFIVGFERGCHLFTPAFGAADQGVHDSGSRRIARDGEGDGAAVSGSGTGHAGYPPSVLRPSFVR